MARRRIFRSIMLTLLVFIVIVIAVLFLSRDAIVNRLSFFPDTTDLATDSSLPESTREVTIPTDDGERLRCFLLSSHDSRNLVIYFHGNAGNIDQRLGELDQLRNLGINVLGVGYRGYGGSSGQPSEKGIYDDGKSALAYAVDSLHFSYPNVYLCGRSIGTTVAVDVASRANVAGVILITPLTDGQEFAASHGLGLFAPLLGHRFDNRGKCADIVSPVLVIHGTQDRIIPYAMGRSLCDALPGRKTFVTIENGDHNALEYADPETYWGAIRSFLERNADSRSVQR